METKTGVVRLFKRTNRIMWIVINCGWGSAGLILWDRIVGVTVVTNRKLLSYYPNKMGSKSKQMLKSYKSVH